MAIEMDFDPVAVLADLGVTPRRITSDSRSVDGGAAFAAYPGARTDGRRYIPDAVANGAMAVLWERRGFTWPTGLHLPQQALDGLHDKLGDIANVVYGFPSRDLWMVGVTGTNGKTSCTHWIAQAAEACGRRTAIVGTLGEIIVGIRRGWFPVFNDDKQCTTFCSLRTVCRIAHVRSLEKEWAPPAEAP